MKPMSSVNCSKVRPANWAEIVEADGCELVSVVELVGADRGHLSGEQVLVACPVER
ncbi:MAG: hypothetical protein ACJ757_16910 [Gaiellaceae bacterium]